jgi:outer membrane autotransporter protein
MIIMAISIVTLAKTNCSYISQMLRDGGLVLLINVCLGIVVADAQNASWLLSPGSSDWNTNANWAPATVPTETATFGPSNTTTITFSNSASVGTLFFNVGAPTYSFSIPRVAGSLTITGTGIVNNSLNRPTFSVTGQVAFLGGSTAGNATITNDFGGSTVFRDTSTAGNATITNNNRAGTVFVNASTAGKATITTNTGVVIIAAESTGGEARFITNAGGLFDISDLSSAGTTAGSIEGAGQYTLGSKTLTVGLNNLSTEVSGTITDAGGLPGTGGALIKVGTGTLTLSGPNTYSGGTMLSSGTLTVGSSQALGTGNVTVNGGVLRADSRPIIVKGHYIQNAGGTLQLRLAGAKLGQYDSLNVTGTAALGGTLQLVSVGFQPKGGDQLTLVTSVGSVSSRFAHLVEPFGTGPGFSTVELEYTSNSVLLKFLTLASPAPSVITTADFASFAQTPNELAAGRLLNAVELNPKAAKLISFLDNEPFAKLPGDLQKITPDGDLTAVFEIGFSGANMQRLNLEGRLDEVRNGSSGFSSNVTINRGTTANLGGPVDGKSSKNMVEPILQPAPENRWGVWITGFGDFVSVDDDSNAIGYSFTTGGVSLGLDYRVTDFLALGIMANYSHTWTDLGPGDIGVDTGRGGIYATYFSHGFYLNGGIYGGYNSYDSSRPALVGVATGNTDGAEFSTFVSGGCDSHFGPLTFGPIGSLQYTNVYLNGFSEHGSLAPLQIHSDSEESLRTDLGLRAFFQWKIGNIVLEPSIKAAWEHEFRYSALPLTASFAEIPGPSATFVGPKEGQDSVIVDAGFSVQWCRTISTYVSYNGQLGRNRYNSNAVTGGFRISF